MFSISLLFPTMCLRRSGSSPDQPSVTVNAVQKAPWSQGLAPCPLWPWRTSDSPQFSCLYNGSVFICVFLSLWKQWDSLFFWFTGRRKGRGAGHLLSTYIISSNLHGDLFVGDSCFHFRNGKQVWLSSWPSYVVPKPKAERLSPGYLAPLYYRALPEAMRERRHLILFPFIL